MPSDSRQLSGTFVYRLPEETLSPQEEAAPNQILVKVKVDGKTTFETVLDNATPPYRFSIPIQGKILSVQSKVKNGSDRFYLLDASVSNRVGIVRQLYEPPINNGFVQITPLPRHALLHTYWTGEKVPLAVSFAGGGRSGEVLLDLSYESGTNQQVSTKRSLHLDSDDSLSTGATSWRVPAVRGPALLSVTQRVDGKVVFFRQMRIAVINPPVNIPKDEKFPIGLHLSSAGYGLATDEVAGITGSRYARVFLRWSQIEVNPGEYDFSRAEEAIRPYEDQQMEVVIVLGEDCPHWLALGSAAIEGPWRRFIARTVDHFRDRIRFWEVFNEIDVKYYAEIRSGFPDGDIALLRDGIQEIRKNDPEAIILCCATGTASWLPYMQRVAATGVLNDVQIFTFHGYQQPPPELRDGDLNLLEEFGQLRMIAAQATSRPDFKVWSTEANWLLGGNAPLQIPLTEHRQAEYLTRASLLAYGVGASYFVHTPFFYSARPEIHADTVAALAGISSFFSSTTDPSPVLNGPDLFGITTRSGPKIRGALWSVSGKARVVFPEGLDVKFFDVYGNQILTDGTSVGTSPTLFEAATESTPLILGDQSPRSNGTRLTPFTTWWKNPAAISQLGNEYLHLQSAPSQYDYQLVSPEIPIERQGCHKITTRIRLQHGTAAFFAINAQTGIRLGESAYANALPDGSTRDAELRFTSLPGQIRFVISNANLESGQATDFDVLTSPTMSACEPGLEGPLP